MQAVEELGERLGDQRADRLAAGVGGAADPAGQVGRELDGEHHPGLGDLDLPALAGLLDVAAGLTLRQSVLGGQLPCRGGDVVAVGQQRHGGVGALRALVGAGSSTTRHDIRILPLVSNRASRQFHTPVGQSSLELEVAYCVGGVLTVLLAIYLTVGRPTRRPAHQ